MFYKTFVRKREDKLDVRALRISPTDEGMENHTHKNVQDCKIEVIKSKTGVDTLVYNQRGQRLFLHSYYDPVREGENWADRISVKGDEIFIVLGCGLGYHLTALNKKLKEGNRVIVIEPEEIAHFVENFKELNGIKKDKRYIFLADSRSNVIFNSLNNLIGMFDLEKIKFAEFKPILRVFKEYYSSVVKELDRFINKEIIDRNTVIFFSQKWTDNFFENLPFTVRSTPVKYFFDSMKGFPIIIVAAGPSLDENIHYLKEAKGKAVIICAGSAFKALLKEGIIPDFIVSIDGSEPNFLHFDGIDNFEAALVFEPMIYPDILKVYKGKKVIFQASPLTGVIQKKLNRDFGALSLGGTVAISAFSLAVRIGGNPIIFVGQDLAYKNGITHASGTAHKNKSVDKSKELIEVEGIDGKPVYTDRVFLSFLTQFEQEIEKYPDIEFIDATEGGAKISGTRIMTLKQVLNTYCKEALPVKETIDSIIGSWDENKIDLTDFKTYMKKAADALEYIKVKCDKAKKYSDDLYEIYNSNRGKSKVDRIIKKLDKLDKIIRDKTEEMVLISTIIMPIIKDVMTGDLAAAKEDETEKEKGLRISRRSQLLYYGISQKCEYVSRLIRTALEKID
ncbi:MAG: hypothetical protein PWP66_522 [Thermosediminibacterales bacterium]|jgi:hypothetical protein|nr:hypothetical protein [Thermosediminibacterales bacterium]